MSSLLYRINVPDSAHVSKPARRSAAARLVRKIRTGLLDWIKAAERGRGRSILVFGLLAGVIPVLPAQALATTKCQGPAVVEGIDVSQYNGLIDWSLVAASGKKFAIARMSDGLSFVDPMFDANYQGIKAAGMVRGSYQFFHPEQDATAQAQLVLAILSKYGPLDAGDLVPVLDVEVTNRQNPATIAAGVATWVGVIKQATGRNPIIYTNAHFWNSAVGTQEPSAGTNLLVAAWGVVCPDEPTAWSNWLIWQYSDSGAVPGIPGSVDLDRFNGAVVTDNVPPAGYQIAPTITIASPNPQVPY